MKEPGRGYRGVQRGAACSLLPGAMARGSVDLVACRVNGELTSWCIWIRRQRRLLQAEGTCSAKTKKLDLSAALSESLAPGAEWRGRGQGC